jgi:mannose-6-phosphate isomerase-like protein (cupin superfamily)
LTDDSKRPWGHYEILYDGDDCKVKRIIVKPGCKLSYQYHFKREELWKIVCGEGFATVNDCKIPIYEGSTIHIEKLSKHRIENTGHGHLVFIEIQTGDYFGEDDIVRLEDDYGRI